MTVVENNAAVQYYTSVNYHHVSCFSFFDISETNHVSVFFNLEFIDVFRTGAVAMATQLLEEKAFR